MAAEEKRTQDEAYWRERLSSEQFEVLRQKGTERAFSGKYWDNHETGMYHCAACDAPLFSSDSKFESGSGWPSFDSPADMENIELKPDFSYAMIRTEVNCKHCGGHLGHLFDDGPEETTGLRYCINSASLDFKNQSGARSQAPGQD